MDPSQPHRQNADDVVAAFRTDLRRGLTDAEAGSRLERYGRNELATEKATPAWRQFLAQFQDVLVILLLVATGISAGLWAYERDAALPYEAIAILAVVLLNATLGYVQQARAEAAVAALRAMSAADADGHSQRRTAQPPRRRDRPRRHHPDRGRRHHPGRWTAAGIGGPADRRGRAHRRKPASVQGYRRHRRRRGAGRPPQHDFQRDGGHLRTRRQRS